MKNVNCIDTIQVAAPQPTLGLPPWITAPLRLLRHWLEIKQQRRRLAQLDDYMLRDIGLTRADVQAEIEKPFWQL